MTKDEIKMEKVFILYWDCPGGMTFCRESNTTAPGLDKLEVGQGMIFPLHEWYGAENRTPGAFIIRRPDRPVSIGWPLFR